MQTKKCSKCGEVKALDQFHQDRSQSDGRKSRCRPCSNEAYRQRYNANPAPGRAKAMAYRAANPEKAKRAYAAYRAANPEKIKAATKARYAANREKAKAEVRAWYAANREKVKRVDAARYAANPEKPKANSVAWRAANPEKVKANNKRIIEDIAPCYIATIMRMPLALVPEDLIEAKRAHLKLVRKLKELR